MDSNIRFVDRSVLGNCPASVDMSSGLIDINKSVWSKYTPFEQQFIVEHENGHYFMQTDDEKEADLYALRKMAGTEKNSLKRCIKALAKVGVFETSRMNQIYIEALKLDIEKTGNNLAKKELNNIINKKMSYKRRYNRIDGNIDETMNEIDETNSIPESKIFNFNIVPNNTMRSVRIGRLELSFTDIALITIAIILYQKLK